MQPRLTAPLAKWFTTGALLVALVLGASSVRLYKWIVPDDQPRTDAAGCVLGDPLRGVQVRWKLTVLQRCVTVEGVVHNVEHSEDGDITFNVKVDPEYEWTLNKTNYATKDGMLHLEIIPLDANRVTTPREGERVRATGVWVTDNAHGDKCCPDEKGHNELHPLTRLDVIQ